MRRCDHSTSVRSRCRCSPDWAVRSSSPAGNPHPSTAFWWRSCWRWRAGAISRPSRFCARARTRTRSSTAMPRWRSCCASPAWLPRPPRGHARCRSRRLAMVATGVAHRRRNSILALHGAAFGLAAAVWSGLLTTSILIWVNPEPWAPMTGAQALALIATGACSAVPAVARARAPQKPPGLVARAARLVLIVGLLTVLGALAVRGITWAMGGRTDSVTLATMPDVDALRRRDRLGVSQTFGSVRRVRLDGISGARPWRPQARRR